jgi:hypothetical protein
MMLDTLQGLIACDPLWVWAYEYGANPSTLDTKYKGAIAEKMSCVLNMFGNACT